MLAEPCCSQMLVDDIGDVTTTNDGATILKLLEIEHPAAKVRGLGPPHLPVHHATLCSSVASDDSSQATLLQILVELAELQDHEVGDGTTSVVIVAAELLKRANDLVRNKIHPTSVISGYRLAMREVMPSQACWRCMCPSLPSCGGGLACLLEGAGPSWRSQAESPDMCGDRSVVPLAGLQICGGAPGHLGGQTGQGLAAERGQDRYVQQDHWGRQQLLCQAGCGRPALGQVQPRPHQDRQVRASAAAGSVHISRFRCTPCCQAAVAR